MVARRGEPEAGRRKLEAISWKREVGRPGLEAGSQGPKDGCQMSEDGGHIRRGSLCGPMGSILVQKP